MKNSTLAKPAYGNTLVKLSKQYPQIVTIDADLCAATKSSEFVRTYPKRAFNVGIAEQDLIGTAAGLSTTGHIPFAATFSIFASGRALDQIRNCVAYNKLNVKILGTHSGLNVGEDGGSHQALEDIAIIRAIPNMVLIAPCDGRQVAEVLEAAVKYDGPVYIRLGRGDFPDIDPYVAFELGKALVLKRGTVGGATIFAHGLMVRTALEAAKELDVQGISTSVVNVATLKPFDNETVIDMLKRSAVAITLEEHSVIGGLGSAVAEVISENGLADITFKRMGIPGTFGQTGTPEALFEAYGLTKEDVVKEVTIRMQNS
jgi:transketolase